MKLCAAALLLTFSVHGAWLRLTSPHFELFTDAGERTGSQTLAHLEQIRHVFLEWSVARPAPLPVRVFLFSSQRDFRAVSPSPSARGFYQGGPERDYIVILAGDDQYRALFHEYVHLVLHHGSASLPRWLEEGTAEFYSTLQARGESILLGAPIPAHLRTLGSRNWLTGNELSRVTRDSEYYNEQNKAGVFYAQSWALVHMLNLSSRYRKNMPRFAELLDQAIPWPLAFEEAFGGTLDAALSDLRAYAANPFSTVPVYWRPPREMEAEITLMEEGRAELVLVDLLLRMGRAQEAERRLRKLPAGRIDPAELETALAFIDLSQKRNQEAMRRLRNTIDSGRATSNALFEYAMLLRESGADPAEVERYLRETIGRNPKHAEAHFLLGLTESQKGRHQDAVEAFEQAVAVLPRQSYFWHALAYSYHHLGRNEQARRAARKAADSASNSHELDMAQAALKLTSSPAAAPVPPTAKTPVYVPDSWKMPQGDARVEGVLEHIECLGAAARFQIRAAGKPVHLWVDKPGEVLLKTASSITFEFRCGPQTPRPVAVEYISKSDASRRTAGEITAIEFR
ncbi:MAG: tetratricopeptide repeat protein [Acidimicrobiia bacterium]|nr:tetratricopeptide repeat protein [Acidimicrobiia bacterium]